jgi:type VI protein secretion system component VasF
MPVPNDSAGAAAAPVDAKSALRIFANAAPPLLAALRQLLAAMFALQRADDPSSFEKVPLSHV